MRDIERVEKERVQLCIIQTERERDVGIESE